MTSSQIPETHTISRTEGFLIGNACILLATFFWGVNVPFTKALIPQWMNAESISIARLIGGCVLFWITSLFIKCDSIEREDWLRIILGGLGLFLFIYLLTVSLRYANAIDVSIIMTLPPMFVILINVIFNHARPKIIEYIGVVVSFIGAVIVILGGADSAGNVSPAFLLGIVLAILSGVSYAFYLVILTKPSRKYHPITLMRWVFLFSALPSLCFVYTFKGLPIFHTALFMPWFLIIFIILCPSYFAYILLQPSLKFIGSELTSLYQYTLPVFAALAAELMGLEKITWMQVIAMAVIVIGMVLTNIGRKRREA